MPDPVGPSSPLALRASKPVTAIALEADEPTLLERRPREVRKGAHCSSQTFVTKVQRETTDDD